MVIMKEKDMFQPIKDFLINNQECSEVHAEVVDIDIVALKNLTNNQELHYALELKTSLNFKVIEQAIRALKFAHIVYIAVPKPKERHSYVAIDLLKNLGIGLIYVSKNKRGYNVEIKLEPKKSTTKRYNIKKYLNEFTAQLVGGVKKGDGETEYSLVMKSIKEYLTTVKKENRGLNNDGWVTAKEIVQNVNTHYASPVPSLTATLQASWNNTWCETTIINRRRYFRAL